jgi:ankyrin repeat protein
VQKNGVFKVSAMQEELCTAVTNGHIDRIRDLLRQGADVNGKLDHWAPLHCAAAHEQHRAAETLLDCRANVDVLTSGRQTALHVALRYRNYDVAFLLLERSASVNAKDELEWTPLHHLVLSARDGWEGISDALFQRGASLYIHSLRGETPLVLARLLRKDIARELELLEQRVHRCRSVVVALFGCRVHHDIRDLLARLVWETRRDPVWDGAKKQCF